MSARVTAYLKGKGYLVVPIRAARDAVGAWQRASGAFRQEQGLQACLVERQQIIAAYMQEHDVRKLQVGAGKNILPGWLNTDVEPVDAGIINLDALDRFPFEDQSFSYVFSEHMIEHIPYRGGLFMLGECFRVLRPGGRIRIATPSIEKIAGLCTTVLGDEQKAYIGWSVEHLGLYASQWTEFQKRRQEWALDPEHLQRHFPKRDEDPACFVVNNFFRSYGHQFLYNVSTLRAALEAVGFEAVTRCHPGESEDEALCGVESHGQHIGEANNDFETMVLEATRPSPDR